MEGIVSGFISESQSQVTLLSIEVAGEDSTLNHMHTLQRERTIDNGLHREFVEIRTLNRERS